MLFAGEKPPCECACKLPFKLSPLAVLSRDCFPCGSASRISQRTDVHLRNPCAPNWLKNPKQQSRSKIGPKVGSGEMLRVGQKLVKYVENPTYLTYFWPTLSISPESTFGPIFDLLCCLGFLSKLGAQGFLKTTQRKMWCSNVPRVRSFSGIPLGAPWLHS